MKHSIRIDRGKEPPLFLERTTQGLAFRGFTTDFENIGAIISRHDAETVLGKVQDFLNLTGSPFRAELILIERWYRPIPKIVQGDE